MKDVTSLQQAFHSIVRAYRVKKRLYAGFRHEADRNTVLDKLKEATDTQGTSFIPLVVKPIDEKTAGEPAIVGTTPFAFGTSALPTSIPLPPDDMNIDNGQRDNADNATQPTSPTPVWPTNACPVPCRPS